MQIEKTKLKLTITFKDESEAERFYEGEEYIYSNILDTFVKGEELIVNGEDYLPKYHGKDYLPKSREEFQDFLNERLEQRYLEFRG